MRLLIATRNPGKLREYRDLLAAAPVELVGLDDVAVDFDADEPHATFHENAIAKARAYAEAAGMVALADDSGLCVDALDGAPGVYSARYGGPGLDDAGRRRHLLAALKDVPDGERGAQFVCVIAVVEPASAGEALLMARGEVRGRIAHVEMDGPAGFGYDPVFIPDGQASDGQASDGQARSFAQMAVALKHQLSHRGRAAAALLPDLRQLAAGRAGG